MKKLYAAFAALLLAGLVSAQTPKEVRQYVRMVDSLRHANKLQLIKLSMMSYCGGAIEGYYDHGRLVYISSYYGGELATYTSRDVYFRDTVAYKITYREHFPEWEKFSKKYPNDDGTMFKHMTYTDTLYTILLSEPRFITKSAGKLKVKPVISDNMIAELIRCAGIMRRELDDERQGKNKIED